MTRMPIYHLSGPAEGIPLVEPARNQLGLAALLGSFAVHSPVQTQYAANETATFPAHSGYAVLTTVRMRGTENAVVHQRSFCATGLLRLLSDSTLVPEVEVMQTEPREIGLGSPPLVITCRGPGGLLRAFSILCHSYLPPIGNIPTVLR